MKKWQNFYRKTHNELCFISKGKFCITNRSGIHILNTSHEPYCRMTACSFSINVGPMSLSVRHNTSFVLRSRGRTTSAIQRNFFAPAKIVCWQAYVLRFLYGFWHIILIKRKGNSANLSNPKHNELANEALLSHLIICQAQNSICSYRAVSKGLKTRKKPQILMHVDSLTGNLIRQHCSFY